MKPYSIFAIFLTVIFSALIACNSGSKERSHSYDYIPLSRFNIDSNAIESGSPVRIIAFSGGKQEEKDKILYFQFIVVKENFDTVRVLTALINVPGNTEQGMYTSPSMFNGDKGIFEATFAPKDSSQNLLINFSSAAVKSEDPTQALNEMLADSSYNQARDEWVVVNKSLPIFEYPNYKTTVGTLKFSSQPW